MSEDCFVDTVVFGEGHHWQRRPIDFLESLHHAERHSSSWSATIRAVSAALVSMLAIKSQWKKSTEPLREQPRLAAAFLFHIVDSCRQTTSTRAIMLWSSCSTLWQ